MTFTSLVQSRLKTGAGLSLFKDVGRPTLYSNLGRELGLSNLKENFKTNLGNVLK